MIDAKGLLKCQAAWQRTRAKLSWAEKINNAARIRNDIACLREGPNGKASGPTHNSAHKVASPS